MSEGDQSPPWVCTGPPVLGLVSWPEAQTWLCCHMVVGLMANVIHLVRPQSLAPASALVLSYSLIQFWPGCDISHHLNFLHTGENVVKANTSPDTSMAATSDPLGKSIINKCTNQFKKKKPKTHTKKQKTLSANSH